VAEMSTMKCEQLHFLSHGIRVWVSSF